MVVNQHHDGGFLATGALHRHFGRMWKAWRNLWEQCDPDRGLKPRFLVGLGRGREIICPGFSMAGLYLDFPFLADPWIYHVLCRPLAQKCFDA